MSDPRYQKWCKEMQEKGIKTYSMHAMGFIFVASAKVVNRRE